MVHSLSQMVSTHVTQNVIDLEVYLTGFASRSIMHQVKVMFEVQYQFSTFSYA